jgi:mannose-6-phosphate isomerase-like protein (cupin superfamily)
MRTGSKTVFAIALLTCAGLPASAQDNPPPPTAEQATKPLPSQAQITAWAAKPASLVPYKEPNRLVWRLADILAAHKGKPDWTQTVHLSRDFIAQWISMGPGEKTKTVFYADDRVFWEVQSGQLKVSIQGQDPFIATKGFLVQVPKRVPYSMETVGDTPSLRFEVRPSGEAPQYPITETPTPVPGIKYVKAVYTGHGDYDAINHPYIDFEKQIVEGGQKIGVWVRDDHTYVTILRSAKGVPTPPPTSWGHFHENFPEFWLIVEGQQQFLVEGEKLVTVGDGDLVATPIGRWHRAEPYGDGPSTRLAFIPRPDNLHWYQPGQAGD